MAVKTWETIKIRYCEHAGCEVALEAEAVYPADMLPDQPARLAAHRCSHGAACMMTGNSTCQWAGSNPAYDPFAEKAQA